MNKKTLNILKCLHRLDLVADTVQIHRHYESTYGFMSFWRMYRLLDQAEEANLVQCALRKGGEERGFRDYKEWRLTGHGLALVKDL